MERMQMTPSSGPMVKFPVVETVRLGIWKIGKRGNSRSRVDHKFMVAGGTTGLGKKLGISWLSSVPYLVIRGSSCEGVEGVEWIESGKRDLPHE